MKSKTIWIIGIVVAVLILFYVLFKDKIGGALSAATGNDGAYDAEDRATYKKMMDLIQSSFGSEVADYIAGSYKDGFAPGLRLSPTDSYGTINGKPTMSAGLLSCYWIWKDSPMTVTDTSLGSIPQLQMKRYTVGQQLADMWVGYRNTTVQNQLKNL